MIITYLRSSSGNTEEFCENRYFLEYVLGFTHPSGKAAVKGTIVHGLMERLGKLKKTQQDGGSFFIDDILGEVDCSNYDLEDFNNKIYDYYSSNDPKNSWTEADRREVKRWVNKCLEYNGGMLDPRNQNIFRTEQRFSIKLDDKDWAKYEYFIGDKHIAGHLTLEGCIDLIVKVNDDTIEIVDYKTGKRIDWSTGEEKTWEKLNDDWQLLFYYYAVKRLFPEFKNVMLSIFYVNDGGLFTPTCYSHSLESIEEKIKEKFLRIKNNVMPKLSISWRCTKFCDQGKTTFEGTSIKPLVEFEEGQFTKPGEFMSKCRQTQFALSKRGIDLVTQHYGKDGAFGKYKAPGAIE